MAAVDIKGTMKEFCGINCLCAFKYNTVPTQPTQTICRTCKKICTVSKNYIYFKSLPIKLFNILNSLHFVVLTALLSSSSADHTWFYPVQRYPQVLQRRLFAGFPQRERVYLCELHLHLPTQAAHAEAGGRGDQNHLQWRMSGPVQRGADILKLWSLKLYWSIRQYDYGCKEGRHNGIMTRANTSYSIKRPKPNHASFSAN